MNLDVLTIQLRQIEQQLVTLLDRPLWETGDLLPADCAGMAARLDTARFAVSMARIRAEAVQNAKRKPLPVCAHDGKTKPKSVAADYPARPEVQGDGASSGASCISGSEQTPQGRQPLLLSRDAADLEADERRGA